MNEHLTSEQISELVAGAAHPTALEHLHACPACRLEAEHLQETIALFRRSVHQWSSQQEIPSHLHLPAQPSSRKTALRRLGWTAALAACLLAGLSLPRFREAHAVPSRPAISDSELLVRVDHELSEAVPPSLEPVALQNQDQK